MKQFIAFIRKEFYHILRDRRTLLILIGMPVVQIILFGFAISTEVKDVQTAILTSSIDSDTRHIIDRIDASEYFTVKYVVHSAEELNRLFRQNKIELGIAFPTALNQRRFDTENIQIIADATDPNLAVTRGSYANGVIATAQAELVETGLKPALAVHTKLLYNPQMRSAYNFVPGVMGLILMLICAMMTSISIVREKETGTMEILLVSPMNPLFVILSKAVPYFALSILNLVIILLLSVFVLDVPIAGSLLSLIGVSLLFIFVSLALGLLISCITRTQVAAMLASGMVLMIPTIILSGIIFPIESMPRILQGVSCLIPARWYVTLVRKLMIEGVPFGYVWQETAILLVMAIVLICITTRKFKNRLE
ncbi:ABC transporter permease [uncultured Sanguibacteroides sp.]|uniref:ABC transporter permease n=1 Tax=uncultured Sanguibacteroides sp. TaxID=1635151 RepID=UPI0025FB96D1|nr:ABC transporter permease [uncultured Sanguibacteroides sp.]